MNSTSIEKLHIPVMLEESLQELHIKDDGVYFDGTLGEGGHSSEILKKLISGILISTDLDSRAIDFVKNTYGESKNWHIFNRSYADIKIITDALNIERLDGALLDLGISTRSIKSSGDGISYQNLNEPLDMRLDKTQKITASQMIKFLSEKELKSILQKNSDTINVARLAKAMKNESEELETVGDLVELIHRVITKTLHNKAKKQVFQALRIAVNSEFEVLEKAIESILALLNRNSSLVIITFHSGEERVVKHLYRKYKDNLSMDRILPSSLELEKNPSSRSAKMYVLKKIL